MWIFTTNGFMSAVADPKQPGVLKVRARRKEVLQKYFPDKEIMTTWDSDYRHRVFVDKAEFGRVVADIASSIDYDNFKGATMKKDRELAHAYADVWRIMYDYQRDDPRYARRRWPK